MAGAALTRVKLLAALAVATSCRSQAPVAQTPETAPAVASDGRLEATSWIDRACIDRVASMVEDTYDQARFAALLTVGCVHLPHNWHCAQISESVDRGCYDRVASRLVPLTEDQACEVRALCQITVHRCRAEPVAATSRVDLACVGRRATHEGVPAASTFVAKWAHECRTVAVADPHCITVDSRHDASCVAALRTMVEHPLFTMDAVWLDEACRVLDVRCPKR